MKAWFYPLYWFLRKECRQLYRNLDVRILIVLFPNIILLVVPFAADYTVKDLRVVVVDHDRSAYSRAACQRIESSGYFLITKTAPTIDEAEKFIKNEDADMILEIYHGFNQDRAGSYKGLSIQTDAMNAVKAALAGTYMQGVLADYFNTMTEAAPALAQIDIKKAYWFNPSQNYPFFMVPGLIAYLVTIVPIYLTTIMLVREKENATIGQLELTPLGPFRYLIGKFFPVWVITVVLFFYGLLIGYLIYGIVPKGNIAIVCLFLGPYVVISQLMAALIAYVSKTQLMALLIAFFFMLNFILLCGIFTPVSSMPTWAAKTATLIPVTVFVELCRAVMMRGTGLEGTGLIFRQLLMVFVPLFALTWFCYVYKRK